MTKVKYFFKHNISVIVAAISLFILLCGFIFVAARSQTNQNKTIKEANQIIQLFELNNLTNKQNNAQVQTEIKNLERELAADHINIQTLLKQFPGLVLPNGQFNPAYTSTTTTPSSVGTSSSVTKQSAAPTKTQTVTTAPTTRTTTAPPAPKSAPVTSAPVASSPVTVAPTTPVAAPVPTTTTTVPPVLQVLPGNGTIACVLGICL